MIRVLTTLTILTISSLALPSRKLLTMAAESGPTCNTGNFQLLTSKKDNLMGKEITLISTHAYENNLANIERASFVLANKKSGRCVHPKHGWANSDGTELIWHDGCDGLNHNRISFSKIPHQGGAFVLQNVESGRCARVSDSPGQGATLFWHSDCEASATNLFKEVTNVGDGSFQLMHSASSMCVHPLGEAHNDVNLVLWNGCESFGDGRISFVYRDVHKSTRVKISPKQSSRQFLRDAMFRVVQPKHAVGGRCDSSYFSLESVAQPGTFLRHRNYELVLTGDTGGPFAADATWAFVPALDGDAGHVSIVASNFDAVIRHYYHFLRLDSASGRGGGGDTTLFDKDASWTIFTPSMKLDVRSSGGDCDPKTEYHWAAWPKECSTRSLYRDFVPDCASHPAAGWYLKSVEKKGGRKNAIQWLFDPFMEFYDRECCESVDIICGRRYLEPTDRCGWYVLLDRFQGTCTHSSPGGITAYCGSLDGMASGNFFSFTGLDAYNNHPAWRWPEHLIVDVDKYRGRIADCEFASAEAAGSN